MIKKYSNKNKVSYNIDILSNTLSKIYNITYLKGGG